MRNSAVTALVAGSVLLAAQPIAQAADPSPTPADLDQRLRIVEHKLESPADDGQAKGKEASANAGDKGFGLKSADGSWELKIRGLVQFDGRFFVGDAAGLGLNDGFTFRRIEPVVEVTAGKLVYVKLQPQFAGDTAGTADLYGELRFAPAFVVRAGKYKAPLGLENLQPASALEFNERGFPTELVANRDLGLQFGGELFASTANYAIGLFNGAADGRDSVSTDTDNRKELAGRLLFEPFKTGPGFFQGLGFGVAGSTGTKLNAVPAGIALGSSDIATVTNNYNNTLPRYRSPGQNTIFSYRIASAKTPTAPTSANTVVANGTHTRWTPQLYYYRHAFGLLGEYVSSKQDVALSGVTQAFDNKAYQGVVSYVLTGEDATYKGVKPSAPYTGGGPGWGAFELAVRYGVLDPDDAAFAGGAASFADPSKSVSKAVDTGLAVNWYLTGNARLSLDYDRTKFTGGAGASFATPTDRETEQALFTRLEFWF